MSCQYYHTGRSCENQPERKTIGFDRIEFSCMSDQRAPSCIYYNIIQQQNKQARDTSLTDRQLIDRAVLFADLGIGGIKHLPED